MKDELNFLKSLRMMNEEYFVDQQSIVRTIWGKSDTILFIFAGASAEFALNKAVDWLYFTGRLPADPLGRLFSTISYARTIVFSETQTALRAIDAMKAIHASVEAKRKASIPDWAYRDVLFMLIDYSIRAYEELERPLTMAEKNEVFVTFNRLGILMNLTGLPASFVEFEYMRQTHLTQDMKRSHLTDNLFQQYQKHLGLIRYKILLEVQTLIVPEKVKLLLGFRKTSLITPLLSIYQISKIIKADWLLREMILPSQYKEEIKSLDIMTGN